jgi:transcriptional regulator with XRE-family HTH domain
MAKKVPKPVDVHVGAKVRARRLEIGMSQEKLGDAIGLTFQQVQKYEKGTNRIGSSRMMQIANSLGVPPTFFFDHAPGANSKADNKKAAPSDFVKDFINSKDGEAIIRAFMTL